MNIFKTRSLSVSNQKTEETDDKHETTSKSSMFMNLLKSKTPKHKTGDKLKQSKQVLLKPSSYMATDHECNFIFEERVKYRIECLEAANRAQKEEMDKMKAKINSLNDIKYKEIESVKK